VEIRIVQATGDTADQNLVEALSTTPRKFLFIFDLQFRLVVVREKAKHFLDIFGIHAGGGKEDLIDNIDFVDMIENDKEVRVLQK
jgi:hypothetical protein